MAVDSYLIPSSSKSYWGQLPGLSLSLALANFYKNTPGISLIIAPDNLTAEQLFNEIQYFLSENQKEVLFFPDWETLPYDHFSPHQDIISQRLITLNRLQTCSDALVISSISTLMHRLPSLAFIHQYSFLIKKEQALSLEALHQQLANAGYQRVTQVLAHGEYAIRGSIMDVFPMGSALPFRLEWFDNTIESLRQFDPENQRTIKVIEAITILPAREVPLDETGTNAFRSAYRQQFSGNPANSVIYEGVSQGHYPLGIEYYLPLFFDKTTTIFDYLSKRAQVFFINDYETKAESFWQEIQNRYQQLQYDIERPILEPKQIFIEPKSLIALSQNFSRIYCNSQPIRHSKAVNYNIALPPALIINRQKDIPGEKIIDYLVAHPKKRLLLLTESEGRRQSLLETLVKSQIKTQLVESWEDFIRRDDTISLGISPIIEGVEFLDNHLIVLTEEQLLGQIPAPRKRSTSKGIAPELIIKDLTELTIGSPIVHFNLGVGRYQGLITLTTDNITNEFLILEYAGADKVYVPITSLHLVSRYTGSNQAPIHKLGSDQWQKEKKKALEKVADVAIELLDIYAKREAKPGFVYQYDVTEYQRFAEGFAFTETPDQKHAIEAIVDDLTSTKPMDRLICGDVGFGKTEVAMRAAFIAVQNGKQVCILVPTTLLASQHFENFRDRFAHFAVTIELLSRFRNIKDTRRVVESIKSGQTDIIIGTHKLFSHTIDYKNLGLLIIDEEHRFGVKQKEYIKSLRTHVDILSMTATPIPRTLNMAMAGMRDISLIATPPAKRLAIKTFWQEKTNALIREAVLREILRGGQVFFLHNKVETIEKVALELKLLVPEAKIKYAHGQMKERQLEQIMADFYHHRFNVLLCTTIIETGIDIPTANTIIIDRADSFGLAQLHQLRGRVGRSHHQAYAYLLTPHKKSLTSDACKRLEAIVALEDLGIGFTLATHDLEIRGAGELLGEEQSGNMQAIGFNLFMEMLDKAVDDLKNNRSSMAMPFHQGLDIELGISAIIPEHYIADIHTRLIMYKRLANATDKDSLKDLQIEFIDRFGLLPDSVKNLIAITQLKLLAQTMGIKKIHLQRQQGKIEFNPEPPINVTNLLMLIQKQSQRYQMQGSDKLKFIIDCLQPTEKITAVENLLLSLCK